MNWTALEEQLPIAVAAAGLLYVPEKSPPEPAVYWADQEAQWRPDAWAMLQIITDVTPFQAERRFRYDPDLDRVVEHIVGLEQLTIQVTVESSSQKLGKSAAAIAQAIRARLWGRAIRDTLRDSGRVALVAVGDVRPAPYLSREDRRHGGAILDLTLRAMSVYHAGEHDYVEAAGISPDGLLEELEAPLWL